MPRVALFFVILFTIFGNVAWSDPVPTTINDFFLPGSQPDESGQIEKLTRCTNCHGGYDEEDVEPVFTWQGGMMSQAMRDPHFFATMAIANQDAPESGDLCLRCHTQMGWLEGRSEPTDGSALTTDDYDGVQCDFCHRLVKPTAIGVNPYPDDPTYTSDTYPLDQTYLSTLSNPTDISANGMFIVDSDQAKRGPYSETVARHAYYYSPFHSDAYLCGTCHDVSNPVFTRDPSGAYVPNAFDTPAPDFNPYTMFPVERTFSEWKMSAYNTPEGVYAPQFGGNKDTVSTCQDCHMRDVTGHGCDKNNAPLRDDLPLHDQTGGNTVVPLWVASLYPGDVNAAALDSGIQRATYMLQNAITMTLDVTQQGEHFLAQVHIVNETGHKLPSGYPEGRRIWINVKAYDIGAQLIYESGAYDMVTADLTHDADVKIYEIKPGISTALAPIVNLPAGPSFHFVLNDTVYQDNRIPPRGFTNAAFDSIQSPPVDYSYADGQYWDDTDYLLPGETVEVVVTLYYQTTSKEYVEFLRDENATTDDGQTNYDLWAANGKSAPVAMATASYQITLPDPVVDLTILFESGQVQLNWSPAQNAASYKIYWLSDPEASPEEWQLLSQQPDTSYTEPLSADSLKSFYSVISVGAE